MVGGVRHTNAWVAWVDATGHNGGDGRRKGPVWKFCAGKQLHLWMTSHDFIAMVGTDHHFPGSLSNQPSQPGKGHPWGWWSVHTTLGRGSSQSHSGLSKRRREEGQEGKEAPELLLASNLGLPAPPGCTGALDWRAPLRRPGRPFHHSPTDDLQASTRSRNRNRNRPAQADLALALDLGPRPPRTNQGYEMVGQRKPEATDLGHRCAVFAELSCLLFPW